MVTLCSLHDVTFKTNTVPVVQKVDNAIRIDISTVDNTAGVPNTYKFKGLFLVFVMLLLM